MSITETLNILLRPPIHSCIGRHAWSLFLAATTPQGTLIQQRHAPLRNVGHLAGELESQLEGLLRQQRELLLSAPVVAGGKFDPQYYTKASRHATFVAGALTAAAILGAIGWASHIVPCMRLWPFSLSKQGAFWLAPHSKAQAAAQDVGMLYNAWTANHAPHSQPSTQLLAKMHLQFMQLEFASALIAGGAGRSSQPGACPSYGRPRLMRHWRCRSRMLCAASSHRWNVSCSADGLLIDSPGAVLEGGTWAPLQAP